MSLFSGPLCGLRNGDSDKHVDSAFGSCARDRDQMAVSDSEGLGASRQHGLAWHCASELIHTLRLEQQARYAGSLAFALLDVSPMDAPM